MIDSLPIKIYRGRAGVSLPRGGREEDGASSSSSTDVDASGGGGGRYVAMDEGSIPDDGAAPDPASTHGVPRSAGGGTTGGGTPDDCDECCPICLVEYEVGDSLRSLPCDHEFHKACVDSWLAGNASCPACRRSLRDLRPTPPPSLLPGLGGIGAGFGGIFGIPSALLFAHVGPSRSREGGRRQPLPTASSHGGRSDGRDGDVYSTGAAPAGGNNDDGSTGAPATLRHRSTPALGLLPPFRLLFNTLGRNAYHGARRRGGRPEGVPGSELAREEGEDETARAAAEIELPYVSSLELTEEIAPSAAQGAGGGSEAPSPHDVPSLMTAGDPPHQMSPNRDFEDWHRRRRRGLGGRTNRIGGSSRLVSLNDPLHTAAATLV